MSCDDVLTGDKMDTLGVSSYVDDVRDVSKKLRSVSEDECKHLEQRVDENLPRRALIEQGRKAVMRRGHHSVQEGPTSVRNECVDRTDAPNQDSKPGGHIGPQEASKVVKGVSDRQSVVKGGGHNGIHPVSDGNQRDIETIVQTRDTRPGGQIQVQEASRDVERELKRENAADSVQTDGYGDRKGAATSTARCESKRHC